MKIVKILCAVLVMAVIVRIGACGGTSSVSCPLPFPFCGGSFPLNTQNTTPYGPPRANVVQSTSDWVACVGLQKCDLSEIFKAEYAAQCSCCASQLCNCTPDTETKAKIRSLNTQQQEQGTTTQCQTNGMLCGT